MCGEHHERCLPAGNLVTLYTETSWRALSLSTCSTSRPSSHAQVREMDRKLFNCDFLHNKEHCSVCCSCTLEVPSRRQQMHSIPPRLHSRTASHTTRGRSLFSRVCQHAGRGVRGCCYGLMSSSHPCCFARPPGVQAIGTDSLRSFRRTPSSFTVTGKAARRLSTRFCSVLPPRLCTHCSQEGRK